MPISNESALTDRERRALVRQKPQGNVFDPYDRVFGAFENGTVFDYGDWSARDMSEAISRDGKVRSQYEVLTLPIRGAAWRVEDHDGDTGQGDLVRDSLGERLGTIIDQATTAIAYKRAYWELTWRLDGTTVVHDSIDLRPATACEAGFDPDTGAPRGFRQRLAAVAGSSHPLRVGQTPGFAVIPPQRSMIYTHGAYASPVKGMSDLDVALWCSQTKNKILFLWFQFLENQSLPKVLVYGDDVTQANELAAEIASMRSSGVMGLPRAGDPAARAFDVLESGGQGAGQFFQAAQYLDTMMVSASLAGFTELASSAAAGAGSYALSADQSDFFLASRQAVADEIAEQIRQNLFGPLVRHNYGPDAPLPKLIIGPLSNRNTDRALNLLTSIVASPQLNVPREFVDMLTGGVAKYLGLDPDKVEEAIEVEVKRREEADKLKLEQQKMLLANPIPRPGQPGIPQKPASAAPGKPNNSKPATGGTVTNLPQRPPAKAVSLSYAVDVAEELVRRARDGEAPESILAEIMESRA